MIIDASSPGYVQAEQQVQRLLKEKRFTKLNTSIDSIFFSSLVLGEYVWNMRSLREDKQQATYEALATCVHHVPSCYQESIDTYIQIDQTWPLPRDELIRYGLVGHTPILSGVKYFLDQKGIRGNSSTYKPINSLSWKDFGGYAEIISYFQGLTNLIVQRSDASKFFPKGILLIGPPGVGKSTLASIFAQESKGFIQHVSLPELASTYVNGMVEKFEHYYANARAGIQEGFPISILVLDELEALYGGNTNDKELEKLQAALRLRLSSQYENEHILTIGMTNQPHLLPPSLLRPGRFDTIFHLDFPDIHSLKNIIEKKFQQYGITENTKELLQKIQEQKLQLTGAHIEYACREAQLQKVLHNTGKDVTSLDVFVELENEKKKRRFISSFF